jgi:hypothetical protein
LKKLRCESSYPVSRYSAATVVIEFRAEPGQVLQLFDLRDHRHDAAVVVSIQRLDAQSIPTQDELVLDPVENHQAPHPAEARETRHPPLTVGGENDLRVGRRAEGMTEAFEFGSDLDVVEDLAVVDDPVPVAVHHRLPAGGTEVENRQTTVPEPDGPG